MSKIYLPKEYLNKPCYVINNGYIRVYNTININQQNTVYDVYINQDYMIKQGSASYSTNTVCDHLNTYTDDVIYRLDFSNYLISLLILLILILGIPLKVVFRLFRRMH